MTRLRFIYPTTFSILIITSCILGDCRHNFIYKGKLIANDSLLNDSLVIRFENLGDIIFNLNDKWRSDTSIVLNNGEYNVTGDFLTSCASDKKIFEPTDSLGFIILHKGKIIKTGKFNILKLERLYTDSAYLTTLDLPVITIE